MVLGVRKVEWGLLWTALSLGLMERGSAKRGLGHHKLPGYRDPWSSLDMVTHLTCLLSWKSLFSSAVLIKAMGACAQVGEGTVPHHVVNGQGPAMDPFRKGLWTFIFFLP